MTANLLFDCVDAAARRGREVYLGKYPGATEQFLCFFEGIAGCRPHYVRGPYDPVKIDELTVCLCGHAYSDHLRPLDRNPFLPCTATRHCTCWRWRPLYEPPTGPFLPGMHDPKKRGFRCPVR